MPASIPNDIYQYSLLTAFTSGLTDGGPFPSMLTNHGTHGIGMFANPENSLILVDSIAYCITSDGQAKPAPRDANLPFTMVTVFIPTFSATMSRGGKKGELEGLFQRRGTLARGKNSPMSFRIVGTFSNVETGQRTPQGQDKATQILKDIRGTIFGFVLPSWADAISGKGVNCYFLSAEGEGGMRRGGYVKDFEAGADLRVEWAKCGRFHLGFPQSEEYEVLELDA